MLPRPAKAPRRDLLRLERTSLESGRWPEWSGKPAPPSVTSKGGWLRSVSSVYSNGFLVVLHRTVLTEWGRVQHLAIRTASGSELRWADKQRVKDELVGPERVAVEVFPPREELVDEAPMYHLWVLPEGFQLPFTLANGGWR